MSIKIAFNGASINKPGGYSALKVAPLTGYPLAAAGVLGLIGPADGGEPGLAGPFSQEGLQSAKLTYKSGPLADAFDLAINPSNDDRIVNGASAIYVYKTNQSTQASLVLATTWGTLTSKLYGLTANQISAKIENSQGETLPSFSFTYVAPAVDATFGARVNGGAEVSVSILAADSAAQAATKIGGLTGLDASAVGQVITVVVSAASVAGMGSSLEIFDGGGTNALTTIGVTAGQIGVVHSSSAERKVVYTFNHPDYDEEISSALGGEIVFEIGYDGTSGTMDISDTQLTTTVAGGTGTSLTVLFANYNNLQEVVNYINSQTGYTCSTSYTKALTSAPTILDNVSSVGICSTAASLKPGRVKADSYTVKDYVEQYSNLVTLSETAKKGLPDLLSITYLSGGTLGTASNTNFQNGFNVFKTARINVVVPVIADDGSAEGYGTYDWDSVASQHKTHVIWGWSTTGKSERQGYIGFDGTKTELKAKALTSASGYVSLCGQNVKRPNASGTSVYMKPWAFAVICGGLRCGAEIGEPLTYKYINIDGLTQDSSWDPKVDYTEMIDAGITFAEKVDTGGYRIVCDNTTYGRDANFVWNRGSVVFVGGYIAYDLRTALENTFTGTKAKTGTAKNVENFIVARMSDYKGADYIVADDSAPKGYKNLSVVQQGNKTIINVTIYPVQGVDFILPTIYLESAVQSA